MNTVTILLTIFAVAASYKLAYKRDNYGNFHDTRDIDEDQLDDEVLSDAKESLAKLKRPSLKAVKTFLNRRLRQMESCRTITQLRCFGFFCFQVPTVICA